MKKIILLFLLISCTITSNVVKEPVSVDTYFCPRDHCLDVMLELIEKSDDIRCAFFELNLPELIDLLEAKNALVVIEDKYELPQFISHRSDAYMHNKFCVLDGNTVITGSMNPTERGNYYNNNNLLVIQSAAIAQNYLNEFEELEKGIHGKGNKVKNAAVESDSLVIENYFCPEDNCKLHVINALREAKESIYFMTFSFTDEDIGNLLWNKDYEGVDVRGVMESRQASGSSRFEDLSHFTIKDNNPYTMHHKVFIIDNSAVITGSFNPTKNANEENDENIVIIHDTDIALRFLEEFSWIQETHEDDDNLEIEYVEYDPEGNDKGREYIILNSTKTINLNYYFISDNKTRSRLNGTINDKIKIFPKFTLRNKEGILQLFRSDIKVDEVRW